MSHKKLESGFGLPQMMVFMSIITISTAAVMRTVNVQMKEHTKTAVHTERAEVKRQLLLNANCKATLDQSGITECNSETYLRLYGKNKLKGAYPLGGALDTSGAFTDSGAFAGWRLKSKCTRDNGLEVLAAKVNSRGDGFSRDARGKPLDWTHPKSRVAVVCPPHIIKSLEDDNPPPAPSGGGCRSTASAPKKYSRTPPVTTYCRTISDHYIFYFSRNTYTSYRAHKSLSVTSMNHVGLPRTALAPGVDVPLATFVAQGYFTEVNLKAQLVTAGLSQTTPFNIDIVFVDVATGNVKKEERLYTGIGVMESYSRGITQDHYFKTRPGTQYRVFLKVEGRNITSSQKIILTENSTISFKNYRGNRNNPKLASKTYPP